MLPLLLMARLLELTYLVAKNVVEVTLNSGYLPRGKLQCNMMVEVKD